MAFPTNWPPRVAAAQRSIRFYVTGTATAAFSGNAFLFADTAGANTYVPLANVPAGSSAVANLANPPYGTGDSLLATEQEPHPTIWCTGIYVTNLSATVPLEISFDGTNVHGFVPAGTWMFARYNRRYEAGIAVRGNTAGFHIEAW